MLITTTTTIIIIIIRHQTVCKNARKEKKTNKSKVYSESAALRQGKSC